MRFQKTSTGGNASRQAAKNIKSFNREKKVKIEGLEKVDKKQFSGNPGAVGRVKSVDKNSFYFPLSRRLIGKLVRLVQEPNFYEFVKKEDREALNKAAGWQTKEIYLLDNVKVE